MISISFTGTPKGQRWKKGRSGGQPENQFGEQRVQCAFIPAVPCPIRARCPHPSAGRSEPQQAAVWEPLCHFRPKRPVFLKINLKISRHTFNENSNVNIVVSKSSPLQMRKTRSSQITSCFDCPPWVRPPGTVTWFASNQHATSAAQKATRIPRRSQTTT